MTIPIDLAETLAAVVDTGTMDAAARRLHITPSAVSQRIRALEERVGQVLLVRAKPARATEAGARVVRLARQYALLAHDTLVELGIDGAGVAGDRAVSIPLAVNADSMATWFLAPLADVATDHRVVFDLHRDDQDFTAALLESGEVVAAVTSRTEPVAGCRVSALGTMRYEAVATPAVAERMGEDAASVPLVDFDRRDDLQSRWLRERGIDPATPPRHYVPGSNDFAIAVRAGLGWGMLPEVQSEDALAAGRIVRLGGAPIDVPLYWQQWNIDSPLLRATADAVAAGARRALRPVSRR
ncbi:LysR family transcriptional regulator ArgP [Microbacterium sp. cx-59]|uniref:LysR family transcriptional regulator ArgP n=1 Tax=Microbacterium sp. cx-59 TaxID=2891207 RepID=UPI001E381BAF|nr:LysR family transcriptional regulator ArgP [Microbacterium sp. cx-59]MCC4909034.1 LysR family transcriptional regulator ArgP [Microbacterium sp. cx-59]